MQINSVHPGYSTARRGSFVCLQVGCGCLYLFNLIELLLFNFSDEIVGSSNIAVKNLKTLCKWGMCFQRQVTGLKLMLTLCSFSRELKCLSFVVVMLMYSLL